MQQRPAPLQNASNRKRETTKNKDALMEEESRKQRVMALFALPRE
jgi:hypothetical protein